MTRYFDPFSDRLARDIRNTLSSALVDELIGEKAGSLADTAARWLAADLPAAHRDYIQRRMTRYREALAHIRSTGDTDPRRQALTLWNDGLFFELHELIETIWHRAGEPERTGLKGLIQAAGAYVHFQRGKTDAARKLALKAGANLAAGRSALDFMVDPDLLISAMKHLADGPPQLALQPR